MTNIAGMVSGVDLSPPEVEAFPSLVPTIHGGMGGLVIPTKQILSDIQHQTKPTFEALSANMAGLTPPPPAAAGRTTFRADISAAPKSVAEVVYDVTPISGIQNLVTELRDTRPRPALPPGIVERAPVWVRERFTQLQRGAVRRLPIKRNVPLPVTRE